jgi:hypothetical protein
MNYAPNANWTAEIKELENFMNPSMVSYLLERTGAADQD